MDTHKIDLVALDEARRVVNLIIMDDQDWSDARAHIDLLHDKLISYVGFIENGTLMKKHPLAQGLKVVIRVIFEHKITDEGQDFIDRMSDVLKDVGYEIEFVNYASL